MSKGVKKKLDFNNDLKSFTDLGGDVFLYVLTWNDSKDIIYVGVTNNIKARSSYATHCDSDMRVIGRFKDRSLAEFFEIRLIEECLSQGLSLVNKITKFSNDKNG